MKKGLILSVAVIVLVSLVYNMTQAKSTHLQQELFLEKGDLQVQDWKLFETQYADFISEYAAVACFDTGENKTAGVVYFVKTRVLQGGRKVTLADFKNVQLLVDDIYTKLADAGLDYENFTLETIEYWTLTEKGNLVVHFPPYVVGPKSLGIITIVSDTKVVRK